MDKSKVTIWLVAVFLFVFGGIAFAQKDKEGCKDHPMFTRIPNYLLSYCRESKFDQVDFRDEKGKEIKVEGRHLYTEHSIKKGCSLK